MKLDYLATEAEIADMMEENEQAALERGFGRGTARNYRYDQTLKQLHEIYLKFKDKSMRPVYLHALLDRGGDLKEDIRLEIISFDESVCLFRCDGRLVGEYSDYLISMYSIAPDTKSEMAQEALRRCEV